MRLKINTLVIITSLACAVVASSAFGQSWTTFRHDNNRTGMVYDTTTGAGDLGAFRPTPTWVFPAPEVSMRVVDNAISTRVEQGFVTTGGGWLETPLNAVGYYGDDYLYTTTDGTGSKTASWTFTLGDLVSDDSNFYVYVWVPATGSGETVEHTSDARYTVTVGTRTYGPYTLNQTSGGGWAILTYQSFYAQKNDTLVVKLTNKTTKTDGTGAPLARTVIADAVMLRVDAGVVISSPIPCPNEKLVLSCRTENMPMMSYNNGQGTNPSVGVLYGIGSEIDSGITNAPGNSDDRGLMKWRFPSQSQDWISLGISSSPALMTLTNECAIIPGLDGTVYAVETNSPGPVANLEWKGPGYFYDELEPTIPPVGAWKKDIDPPVQPMTGRRGASASTVKTVPASTAPATITANAVATWRVEIPASSVADRKYDVYAWIPPAVSEDYATDARYSVSGKAGFFMPEDGIPVYQGMGGFWAIIKTNYLVPKDTTGTAPSTVFFVNLCNETSENRMNYGTTPATPIDTYVVADAIKVVPAGLSCFDESSPLVAGGSIYVCSVDYRYGDTMGKLYKLTPPAKDPDWAFPTDAEPMVGGIYGSPTLSPDGQTIYFGSTDGHLYAVYATGAKAGTKKWIYPNPSGLTPALPQISVTGAALDANGHTIVYFATGGNWFDGSDSNLEGRIYAIADAPDATMPYHTEWVYPGGSTNLGAFLYSSPLLFQQKYNTAPWMMSIASTDGYLYTMNAETRVNDATTPPVKTDLNAGTTSSMAGSYASFAPVTAKTTPRTAPVAMGFIGAGSRIYGVDLSTGVKDWWWDLAGGTHSSPSISNDRIYIGDMEGYTWAFSSGPAATGGGGETWNPELGSLQTSGSDPTPGGNPRESHPMVDVFLKSDWETLKTTILEIAENSPDPAKWFESDKFRDAAMDYSTRASKASYPMEWGEDLVFVVWNLLDPNRQDVDPLKWQRPWMDDPANTGTYIRNTAWSDDYHGKVELTIKSRAPGKAADTSETITLSGHQIDCFTDETEDTSGVAGIPNEPRTNKLNGFSHFYAAYVYALDGSSTSKSQTPGSQFTISAREVPAVPNTSSVDVYVPKDPSKPTATNPTIDPNDACIFGINNPLALKYKDVHGVTTPPGLGEIVNAEIGLTPGSMSTTRAVPDAQVNGNGSATTPVIWGGFTPHNKLSATREVTVCDRSMLFTIPLRKISRFRVERHDMRWTGGTGRTINMLPWENVPGNTAAHLTNGSDDYPNIDLRQIRLRMLSNGMDPSQGSVDLRVGAGPVGSSWPVSLNPVDIAVEIPQFQPTNMPDPIGDPAQADKDRLNAAGYNSYIYTFVDSNNNGVFDKPAGLGINALLQQKVSGVKSEAFRILNVQAHVPADFRAQIEEQRINIGDVPQGFGFTAGAGGIPNIFMNDLVLDPISTVPAWLAPGDPTLGASFQEWFKTFTVRNTGNVNLKDISLIRSDLVSDTVQSPVYDATGNMIWGSGFAIPAAASASTHLVSTIDARTGFMNSVPPPVINPMYVPVGLSQVTSRTFHKGKVGESAPDLRLPDFDLTQSWKLASPLALSAKSGPQLPRLSVAVPIGTPAGTYAGTVQLAETANGKTVAISNPVEVVVTAKEARLTGGSTLNDQPHPPHLELPMVSGSSGVLATGNGMPAAYRNPVAPHNMMLFWSSSRYGKETRGGGAEPTSSDPWFLYSTKLENDPTIAKGWKMSSAAPTQWWSPTTSTTMFPALTDVENFFPGPGGGDPGWGAPGTIVPGTVKFSSPSVAVDKVDAKAYLMFLGQTYKDAPTQPGSGRTLESRAYYTEIVNEQIDESKVYSTSPNQTTENIHGDWTTPKFGIRGAIMRRDPAQDPPSLLGPQLWNFWYGGGNGKWRIYYNMKKDPSQKWNPSDVNSQWTNEALLPVPKGLSSVAEPSPIFRWTKFGNSEVTGKTFDVVYAGVSSFHNNSDIYLSRYTAANQRQTVKQGSSWPVTLELLPQRGTLIPELMPRFVDPSGSPIFAEKLTRDASLGVWYARDVDWLSDVVSTTDASPTKPTSFDVFVRLDPADPTTVYQLNVGPTTKDSGTGAILYTYDSSKLPPGGLRDQLQALRTAFRAVMINPVDGTVKFMRQPGGKTLVVAKYFPKAYRITTDRVSDGAPFGLMDTDANPRYDVTGGPNPAFFIPSTSPWVPTVAPPTDRLWVFWRRPAMDRPGTGVFYKAHRYMVQLNSQIRLDVTRNSSTGKLDYSPAITAIEPANPAMTFVGPVEIDWVKNRLYFIAEDGVEWLPDAGGKDRPHPKKILVTYEDNNADPSLRLHTDEPYYVQYVDEDLSQAGKTYGNLTSLMVNEGQVSAFKDPGINRIWVFWSSTRSGNADLYYETISPRFAGKEYK